MKRFDELTEAEVLALAISNEEEDGRIYADFAHALRDDYPDSARMFDDMAEEEDGRIYADFAHALRDDYPDSARMFDDMAEEEGGHRRQLIDSYSARFGTHIPLVRRADVKGNIARKPVWQVRALGVGAMRRQAAEMERDAERFYRQAAARSTDAAVRKLLGDLAEAEAGHERTAGQIEERRLPGEVKGDEDADAKKRFILQVIQPGLVGLMDGSVSTLAPVFAAAFATHSSWNAFLVGLAASLGAGISMGFAEALADDGVLSGRGTPLLRGLVCGLMTIAGGIGHTIPYLIPDFYTATLVAAVVVVFELAIIAWIQWRYMDTPPLAATAKVMLGGGLVLATGILIGQAG